MHVEGKLRRFNYVPLAFGGQKILGKYFSYITKIVEEKFQREDEDEDEDEEKALCERTICMSAGELRGIGLVKRDEPALFKYFIFRERPVLSRSLFRALFAQPPLEA